MSDMDLAAAYGMSVFGSLGLALMLAVGVHPPMVFATVAVHAVGAALFLRGNFEA